ncbi:MAG: hypothetical protein ACLS9Z_09460, partial [Christensenellaceae bacterium]
DWRLLRWTIFISWWGQGITVSSFLWLIGWGGGLPPHFGQKKSRKPFRISCLVVPPVGGGYSFFGGLSVRQSGSFPVNQAESHPFLFRIAAVS